VQRRRRWWLCSVCNTCAGWRMPVRACMQMLRMRFQRLIFIMSEPVVGRQDGQASSSAAGHTVCCCVCCGDVLVTLAAIATPLVHQQHIRWFKAHLHCFLCYLTCSAFPVPLLQALMLLDLSHNALSGTSARHCLNSYNYIVLYIYCFPLFCSCRH
jgi:hypothetical protein